ncbi:hypothetical protein FBF34_00220 [Arachnia propionica]|uniref:Immunity protein 52 domain-containing protein n=1 Tax=Arachnia propionica TaxID=1750 RepID=A0AB37HU30_9ACTN|nr:hypothetical protein [Arachnia propionica]QCT36569.1 hypothetical protein FBF34_00220 [Arachnia propionica]QUC11115.1 hypothetical protein J5A53_15430 [Arachnia propionica]
MTHELGDIFVYASWGRLNETPEEIARRTSRFMEEFSSRVSVGRWRPTQQEEGEWDGTEAGLAGFIGNRIMRKDDGENAPEGGYHFLLETENDLLETLFTVTAGQSKILEPVYSPSFYQQFGWVPFPDPDQPPCVSADFLWEASIRAVIPAFDPNFAVGQELDVIMEQEPEGWLLPIGYRVWINERVGGVRACAEGLTVERLGNGTLIRVPDSWPAERVIETLTETFRSNDLDGLL